MSIPNLQTVAINNQPAALGAELCHRIAAETVPLGLPQLGTQRCGAESESKVCGPQAAAFQPGLSAIVRGAPRVQRFLRRTPRAKAARRRRRW